MARQSIHRDGPQSKRISDNQKRKWKHERFAVFCRQCGLRAKIPRREFYKEYGPTARCAACGGQLDRTFVKRLAKAKRTIEATLPVDEANRAFAEKTNRSAARFAIPEGTDILVQPIGVCR